jgi:hypothetical protein
MSLAQVQVFYATSSNVSTRTELATGHIDARRIINGNGAQRMTIQMSGIQVNYQDEDDGGEQC